MLSLRLLTQIKTASRLANSNPTASICQRLANLSTEAHKSITQNAESSEIAQTPMAKKNVSKAMKAYLERAKEHDDFMKQQNTEYQIGKRHLANMMGADPETFTQDDIDVNIGKP